MEMDQTLDYEDQEEILSKRKTKSQSPAATTPKSRRRSTAPSSDLSGQDLYSMFGIMHSNWIHSKPNHAHLNFVETRRSFPRCRTSHTREELD